LGSLRRQLEENKKEKKKRKKQLKRGRKKKLVEELTASVRRITIGTSIESSAFHVLGLVLLASDVWNTILVNPGISGIGITTITTAGMTTVD
jgi:hypothetical protein